MLETRSASAMPGLSRWPWSCGRGIRLFPPSERQDQMLRAGPSRRSHGIKAATFQSTPLPQAFEEAAGGFVL